MRAMVEDNADGLGLRWLREHRFLTASVGILVVSVVALVVLGIHYWREADYWLVGIPGFGTAIGTIGLAGATFRLIQREDLDRTNTITALSHSQTMATEAARARRDDRARLVRLSHFQQIKVLPEPTSEKWFEDGVTFDMPVDASRKLCVQQYILVETADGEPMSVRMFGLQVYREPTNGAEPVRLPIGRHRDEFSLAAFVVERTVSEWVEIAKRREAGDGSDEGHASIIVDDGFDDGVSDTYDIVQGGCPLRPSPQRDGQWILDTGYDGPMHRVGIAFLPMRRRYFVSKIGNEDLPSAT